MRHLARGVEHALDVRFSGPQHPDVRKHQRTAAFCGADQVRPLICAPRKNQNTGGRGLLRRGLRSPRLATGHAIVQRILATTRRQAARYLVHDPNDLPHNITAVAAGGIFEPRRESPPWRRLDR